ncbi:YlbG family protein [Staphylococcus pettenkoferi]|uniref:YlbG family protein n=1 Tax=Staphylococcus pettenkoferi TaxID=170573 RepID=UPI00066E97B4|nr:YlbG family protein [Staphylococcus pettenkoferi]MDK7114112.1 YlbG family protein [Staphylococcus pettenkoferi]
MNIVSRASLIIYLKNMKYVRQLKKHGHVIYVNPRRHYVIMYVEENQADRIVTQLMKLKYINHIQGSPYKNLKKVYEKEKHELS